MGRRSNPDIVIIVVKSAFRLTHTHWEKEASGEQEQAAKHSNDEIRRGAKSKIMVLIRLFFGWFRSPDQSWQTNSREQRQYCFSANPSVTFLLSAAISVFSNINTAITPTNCKSCGCAGLANKAVVVSARTMMYSVNGCRLRTGLKHREWSGWTQGGGPVPPMMRCTSHCTVQVWRWRAAVDVATRRALHAMRAGAVCSWPPPSLCSVGHKVWTGRGVGKAITSATPPSFFIEIVGFNAAMHASNYYDRANNAWLTLYFF